MNLLYLGLGVILLFGVAIDLLWTTLWVEGGAGPLTHWLMTGLWAGFRTVSDQDSRVLRLAGPLILLAELLMWVILLWVGWTLVFASAGEILIDTLDRGPVSWTGWLYFVGYTLFTLGNGDYAVQDGIWQPVTAVAALNGLVFLTLGATYFLSVLRAVTQKRAFAMGVTGLGTRSEAIVRSAWDGEEFQGLNLPLITYTAELDTLTSNYEAYPILHYFYEQQERWAPVIAVCLLDETLTLLRFGVQEHKRLPDPIINNARSSVQNHLDILSGTFIESADRAPPAPDLDSLREAGVPVMNDQEFDEALNELRVRRQDLLGLVEGDARQWSFLKGK